MELCVRGHPLHSRLLSVTLAQRADGRLDVFGEILDLRKCGFVPVAGDLQASGIVHQMQLRGVVEPASARLEALSAAQPAVAFEPSALTQGECCRDPIDRIQALVGSPLDRGFAKRWLAESGRRARLLARSDARAAAGIDGRLGARARPRGGAGAASRRRARLPPRPRDRWFCGRGRRPGALASADGSALRALDRRSRGPSTDSAASSRSARSRASRWPA